MRLTRLLASVAIGGCIHRVLALVLCRVQAGIGTITKRAAALVAQNL